jgi:hypothetical protein
VSVEPTDLDSAEPAWPWTVVSHRHRRRRALVAALVVSETLCPDHVIVNVGAIDAAAAQLAAVIGAAAD